MDQELILAPDTLITSKTDLKGHITYCNKDFLQYSKYQESELLGKPHNIIRHPDMPKSVFKLLWDYIQKGQEIFAFVKNKNKYGEFYWVFANITPSFDTQGNIIGYYSVRRKPNPTALTDIAAIYTQLKGIEKTENITGGMQWLQQLTQKAAKPYNQIILEMQMACGGLEPMQSEPIQAD
ncbi:histidine kinase [Helicobacter sp. 12S02634-8]|uniref:PAS domain-containing protein n=1 Tax=Helicobacter sp. 12S02634-8 TaxID=1476199 RepID=UPI000BA6F2B5|nr:PAS domain-containing protein [Helicobacter sp. 12S02634-8]PAF48025.1 histidine kinase [Helicobacter sp. 12S02634-8]